MKYLYIFCIFQLLLLPLRGETVEESTALHIVSFNIHYDKKGDPQGSWESRKEMVMDIITSFDFDMAGLQEVSQSQLVDFQALGTYGTIGEGINGGTSGSQNTILYKKSRVELLDSGIFWLSSTPEYPSLGWDATFNRNCPWGKFRDRLSGKEFFFFDAHFDHYGEEARINSAYLVYSVIKEKTGGLPVFFMGDLNSEENSETIAFLNKKLSNARENSLTEPKGPVGTGHGFRINRNVRRIDYIYYSGENVQIVEFETIDRLYDGKAPSDHWAIRIKAILEP